MRESLIPSGTVRNYETEVSGQMQGSRSGHKRSSLGLAAGLCQGRVCAGASWTSSAKTFEWHGRMQTMSVSDSSSLSYLCVSFPPSVSTQTRRALHHLSEAAGLECVSCNIAGARCLRLGSNLECEPAAELNFADETELSAEEICLLLAANFGLTSISAEDIT